MSDDYVDDPQFQEWAEGVRAHLMPALSQADASVMLVPTDADVKFAVELGMSIMLDKPIIAVVTPGVKPSSRLIRVADRIVEMDDVTNPESRVKLQAAIEAAMAEVEAEE